MIPAPLTRTARRLIGIAAVGRLALGRLALGGPAIGIGVGLGGCAQTPASVEGSQIRGLYDIFLWVAAGVFLLVAGLIGWSIVRYRAPEDGELPPQTEANVRLELVWWALPTILVIVLFVLTAGVLNSVDARAPQGETLVVRVTGFQWQWRFTYEASGVEITGTPADAARITLPVDRPVTFLLDSADVQHAFYVPRFLFKRDMYPGRENRVDLTVDEPGTYAGQCAEFCGLLHARMTFTIEAVDGAAFDAWLADQEGGA